MLAFGITFLILGAVLTTVFALLLIRVIASGIIMIAWGVILTGMGYGRLRMAQEMEKNMNHTSAVVVPGDAAMMTANYPATGATVTTQGFQQFPPTQYSNPQVITGNTFQAEVPPYSSYNMYSSPVAPPPPPPSYTTATTK